MVGEKLCYCYNCDRWFHYFGIATHRATHKRRGEICKINYTDGITRVHDFRRTHEQKRNPRRR